MSSTPPSAWARERAQIALEAAAELGCRDSARALRALLHAPPGGPGRPRKDDALMLEDLGRLKRGRNTVGTVARANAAALGMRVESLARRLRRKLGADRSHAAIDLGSR